MNDLYLLKLGGSLITDKTSSHSARHDVIKQLSNEIKQALDAQSGLKLIIGHGSGSFGHVPAKKYGTRGGVRTKQEWIGFSEVWQEAHALNQIILDALLQARLPVIVFPASACVSTANGKITHWNLAPMESALENGIIPLVYGDVVFDSVIGGTILSTEDLFFYLAPFFHPTRILLAGLEHGVFADYPLRQELVSRITPRTFSSLLGSFGGAAGVDVTGGMFSKVLSMVELVQHLPATEIIIFSAQKAHTLLNVLSGDITGTTISADQ